MNYPPQFVQDGEYPQFVYRQFEFDKGQGHEGGQHTIDHPSILVTGSVRVDYTKPDGTKHTVEFTAPSHFIVKANVMHSIFATSDGTKWLCLFMTPPGYESDLKAFWNEIEEDHHHV